jgi:hypothetical protein
MKRFDEVMKAGGNAFEAGRALFQDLAERKPDCYCRLIREPETHRLIRSADAQQRLEALEFAQLVAQAVVAVRQSLSPR